MAPPLASPPPPLPGSDGGAESAGWAAAEAGDPRGGGPARGGGRGARGRAAGRRARGRPPPGQAPRGAVADFVSACCVAPADPCPSCSAGASDLAEARIRRAALLVGAEQCLREATRFHQRPAPSPAWHGEDFVRPPAPAGAGFVPRSRLADPQRVTRQFTTPPPSSTRPMQISLVRIISPPRRRRGAAADRAVRRLRRELPPRPPPPPNRHRCPRACRPRPSRKTARRGRRRP